MPNTTRFIVGPSRQVFAREIGTGWMRGAKAEAEGIDGAFIHPPHLPPPRLGDCDIELSAAYGSLKFQAFTKREYLATVEEGWLKLMEEANNLPDSPLSGDLRSNTRALMLEMVVANRQYESGDPSAMVAGAIYWLARTSSAGAEAGEARHIHYEITETDTPGLQNFRLTVA